MNQEQSRHFPTIELVLGAIRFVAGLLLLVFAVTLLWKTLANFSEIVAVEVASIDAILAGSGAALIGAAAWIPIAICILAAIFLTIWLVWLQDPWWQNWVARWLALGNCAALPTWWQRARCRWWKWNLIQELLFIGVFISIIGAIVAANIVAFL